MLLEGGLCILAEMRFAALKQGEHLVNDDPFAQGACSLTGTPRTTGYRPKPRRLESAYR